MTKRRADQSQLDWLWENLGDKTVSGTPEEVGGDAILTKDGVSKLIASQTSRLLASLELINNEQDTSLLDVFVVRSGGRKDKAFSLDKEDHLVKITQRNSTQIDVDAGITGHIGKPVADFIMKSGNVYTLSMENMVLTGSKTKTIETLVQSGHIYSELIIAPNNDTAITCTDSQNGLYVTLRLSQKKGQIELLKNENGLVAEFKWADGSDVQLREMDWAKYAVDEGNRKGVIYFVKDKKFMVLNGVRYGEIPDDVVRYTTIDEETGLKMILLGKLDYLAAGDEENPVTLIKLDANDNVSVGDSSVPLALHGSDERFSYNGEEVANKADVDSESKRVDSMINQVNENVSKSIETINEYITNSINTINGAINDEIRPNINKALNTSEQNKKDIATLNQAVITVNQNVADGFAELKKAWENAVNTINGGIDNEIRPTIKELQETSVKWMNVATVDNPGRKAIVLKNHDLLLGTDTKGKTYTIGMINKWDVVDLGTSSLPINLNTPAGVRPTVQEAGQTGEEANKIAYLSDVEGVEASLENTVKYDDVSTEEKPGRKAITLKNDDLILGATTSGGTVNIAMVNKWDIVDLGSNQLPINLNTPAGVRPTVQEAGQSGEEANKIAYLSDIDDINTALGNYLTREEFNNLVKDAPEALDTLKEIADKLADNDNVAVALTTQISDLSEKVDEEVSRSTSEDEDAKKRLQTLETGLSELKEKAVLYEDVATEENPERKAILLDNHDTILGKTTDGTAYNLIMLSKWDKVDVGSGSVEINLNGSAERPTYNDDEELALMKDIEKIKLPIEFSFPLRTLQDKVYTQEEILGWFGASDVPELKTLIVREGQFYLRYGIQLSGNPYYYKMPIQYIAFESANQIKMVVIGLDTRNDMPVKYEIIINLDGTIAEGNSNIKVTSSNLAFESSIPSVDEFVTKDEVALKANQSDVDFQINALNDKVNAIVVPTKVSELENNSAYQTASDVDNRINQIVGTAPEALDTLGEIAAKLADNDDAVAALTNQIAGKASSESLTSETEARSLADTNLQNDLQSESEARISKDAELEESIGKKVEWTDVATEDNPGRKSVILANHDTILGRKKDGTAVNIAMVSKWDKVDMGSAQLPFNMNGSEERPTYNDDKSLALMDDVNAMYSRADMFGDLDPAIFSGGYTMQILTKLEQSYVDDLGNPANVDGQPYDASSNPYFVGQPYLVVASIDNIFSYDLYDLNTYNMGMVGQIARIMKVTLDGYDIKISNIEKRLSALESQ